MANPISRKVQGSAAKSRTTPPKRDVNTVLPNGVIENKNYDKSAPFAGTPQPDRMFFHPNGAVLDGEQRELYTDKGWQKAMKDAKVTTDKLPQPTIDPNRRDADNNNWAQYKLPDGSVLERALRHHDSESYFHDASLSRPDGTRTRYRHDGKSQDATPTPPPPSEEELIRRSKEDLRKLQESAENDLHGYNA